MMNYTVMQVPMNKEIYDFVNQYGHEAAIELYPQYEARMKIQFFGSKNFLTQMSEYFVPVCQIDVDTLDQVFQVGNIGPESKIMRLERMHSVSVGDVIRCNRTNTYYMVDDYGFTQLLNFLEMETV